LAKLEAEQRGRASLHLERVHHPSAARAVQRGPLRVGSARPTAERPAQPLAKRGAFHQLATQPIGHRRRLAQAAKRAAPAQRQLRPQAHAQQA
jgi:hypothetical protein